MTSTGTFDTISPADVFRILGVTRRTGFLEVESGGCRKRIVLDDGHPVFCSAGSPKEFLGHHLLARTAVSPPAPLTERPLA